MKKQLTVSMIALAAATAAFAAAPSRSARRGAKAAPAAEEGGAAAAGRDARVTIDQMPRIGSGCCFAAPGVQGGTAVGQCYTKPRQWIVIETKYSTSAKFVDQLTFNWHVVLETKSAKENKGNRMGLAPYSYFNTSVTYFNIPQGSHAACVCLPPSYLELYGEPKAIGIEIVNANGEVVGGDSVSAVSAIKAHSKFWEMDNFKEAMGGEKPNIERRQGLVDRSKTIWALVNPNDYETTMQ